MTVFTKLLILSDPVQHPGKMLQQEPLKGASKSLRDLRIAEVQKLDIKLEDGKPAQFRANLRLSFKYQD